MCEVRSVKADRVFPAAIELMDNNIRVRITVTGRSMYPFLRENLDSVELKRTDYSEIKRGDIVLILRDNGMYVLHRVLRKEREYFFMVGDAQQWIEGPLNPEQLIAKVTSVWRGNKCITCSTLSWRFLSQLWLCMLPLRYFIIKNFGRLRRLISPNERA